MLILLFWCREKERTVTFVLKERAEPLTEQSHLICFRKVLKYSPSCASLAQVGVSSVSVWRGPTQVCVTEMTSERESNALLSARLCGSAIWGAAKAFSNWAAGQHSWLVTTTGHRGETCRANHVTSALPPSRASVRCGHLSPLPESSSESRKWSDVSGSNASNTSCTLSGWQCEGTDHSGLLGWTLKPTSRGPPASFSLSPLSCTMDGQLFPQDFYPLMVDNHWGTPKVGHSMLHLHLCVCYPATRGYYEMWGIM